MNGKGELIADDQIEHVWLADYSNCLSSEDMKTNEFKVNIARIIQPFSWTHFLDALLPVFNANFFQSVMMLAGAIACFHYPYAIKIAGIIIATVFYV